MSKQPQVKQREESYEKHKRILEDNICLPYFSSIKKLEFFKKNELSSVILLIETRFLKIVLHINTKT